jgi:hypothetical protein
MMMNSGNFDKAAAVKNRQFVGAGLDYLCGNAV